MLALRDQAVGEIDPGDGDVDQEMAGLDDGIGDLLDAEIVDRSEFAADHGLHV